MEHQGDTKQSRGSLAKRLIIADVSHLENDIVGDQSSFLNHACDLQSAWHSLACLHWVLVFTPYLLAKGRTCFDLRSNEIASGYVRHAEVLGCPRGVSPFPYARSTKENPLNAFFACWLAGCIPRGPQHLHK